jgi:hypothetical protein
MKRHQAVRWIATLAAIVCMLAWLPGQAAASTTQSSQQASAGVSAPSGSVDASSTSPFSKKDLIMLAAGATALVAFGVGFRRISAPLE